MASSSVPKMAAVFMLALFAGQALMATLATAEGLGNRHNLLEKYDETQCRGYATCNIVCFYQVFQVCIIYSPVALCNTWAFEFCKDKRYWGINSSAAPFGMHAQLHEQLASSVSTIVPWLLALCVARVLICSSLYFQLSFISGLTNYLITSFSVIMVLV